MLGKLFKHEFCETSKLLVPLNLILILMTIIGVFLINTEILQDENFVLLLVACVILYVFSIFALYIVTAIYLLVRYYRTMYSSQGYLTHTLPVSTTSIVNTKILVSTFWLLVSLVITIISIVFLVCAAVNFDFSELDLADSVEGIHTAFGIGPLELLFLLILSTILSCLNMVLMVTASMSIGQLCSKASRIIISIVAYFVFNLLQTISSYALGMLLGISNMDTLTAIENSASSVTISNFYRETFWFSIVFALVYCIVFYVTSLYLTNKKLNLE